jgi:hypothetical protein
VLIELATAVYVATTALPEFIGALLCDHRGASALVYRGLGSDAPVGSSPAAAALGRMERGGLRASAILDDAVELRQLKHFDPVLGAVSAYLYDSIGDVDSIRRMAYAYQSQGEPIPYDIALLGQLEGHESTVGLHVDIPEVPARDPRTEKEARFGWTYGKTRRAQGTVAGCWPLLRQGWEFFEDSPLVMPGLVELTRHLTPAPFATLDAHGAARVAALLGLERRPR